MYKKSLRKFDDPKNSTDTHFVVEQLVFLIFAWKCTIEGVVHGLLYYNFYWLHSALSSMDSLW